MGMNRIIWHHTGGGYTPNHVDKAAYHRLIDGNGKVHEGDHPISANQPGRRLTSGTYAPHCRGLNSGSIGMPVCAMGGAVWADPGRTDYPVTEAQILSLVKETASLCLQYGIPVSRRTTLSHAEVELTLGVWQSGKWDFDYQIPVIGKVDGRDPIAIGDALRELVADRVGDVPVQQSSRPLVRQGATGYFVREIQEALGTINVDGAFGPITHRAVVSFQKDHQLLPDGIVGPQTWAALLRQ